LPGGPPDALDAEGALFHDAPAPDGDVAVKVVVVRFGPAGLPEVEHPGIVRAVVLAVAGTDAPVINLDIKPLGVVVGGVDRADRLAGGVGAVLTEHRQEPGLHVRVLGPVPVALDPDPFKGPPLEKEVFGIERQVVLALTGHHAGLTAGTAVEVDHHSPANLLLLDHPGYSPTKGF
jgi:hypothetical protein